MNIHTSQSSTGTHPQTPKLWPPILCQVPVPRPQSCDHPRCCRLPSQCAGHNFHMTQQKSQRQDNCTTDLASSVFRRRISSPALPSPPNYLSPLTTHRITEVNSRPRHPTTLTTVPEQLCCAGALLAAQLGVCNILMLSLEPNTWLHWMQGPGTAVHKFISVPTVAPCSTGNEEQTT